MSKISTYPFPATPSASDYVVGTDTNDALNTKNFMISDIIALAGSTYVPYTGATQNVDLGSNALYTYGIVLQGGTIVDGNDSEGTAGQVLTSQGPGNMPLWQDIPENIYGSFYDTTTQTCGLDGIEAMTYDTTVVSNGVSIVANSQITFAYSGVYNIQFSAQLYRTAGGSSKQVTIWLRKNGVDVDWSAGYVTMEANGDFLISSWNYFESVNAGDYVEIMWSQNDAIEIAAAPPNIGIPYPATPSVILTASKVS